MDSDQNDLQRVSGVFPWTEGILASWPPAIDVPLFRSPLDDRFTLQKLHCRMKRAWGMQSNGPMPVESAASADEDLQHHGRPVSAIEAYYRLLFGAWERQGWGRLDPKDGFHFTCESSAAEVPFNFQIKVKRTTSMVDLDHTARVLGITTNNIHLLIHKLPGVEMSVFHLLESELKPGTHKFVCVCTQQTPTWENGCALQECVLQVVKEFRRRVEPGDREQLTQLWDKRNVHLIIWNGHDLRLWHWSRELTDTLRRVARFCLKIFLHPVSAWVDGVDGMAIIRRTFRSMGTQTNEDGTPAGEEEFRVEEQRSIATQWKNPASAPSQSRKRNSRTAGVEEDRLDVSCMCRLMQDKQQLIPLEQSCMWCAVRLAIVAKGSLAVTFV